MRRKTALLFIASSLFASSTICYQTPGDIKTISKKEIAVYKKHTPFAKVMPESAIRDTLLKERLFAKAFLKKNSINENEKIAVNQAVAKTLAEFYVTKLEKENTPSEKVLKSFYLDHIDSFKPLELVSVSTIAVDSLKKADEIYLKLKKDPNLFEKIAKKESVDPSASNGGHYKNVSIATFAPAVREWIREHKKDTISEPIKVGRFYYIDRIDAKKKRDVSYKSLKSDMKKLLLKIYSNNKVKKEFKRLKKEEGIK